MTDIAIRAEGLGKQYSIGKRERYRTLRDTLADTVSAPVRWLRSAVTGAGRSTSEPRETLWALKDVSFDVPRGSVLGVIGRNGAGKSTLLKLLSRITEPTEGHAEIRGRVGSLLEVGTGFHPELTGRENVFLNGAILGMRRAEIARKFDEIVAFAEVDKFVDTPVKHYSSGMYMRLAFAVAAHLEPEILIVDEVLAVGDAKFQKKCLGKMGDVAREGRTILFVSHSMASVASLCHEGLMLDQGTVVCHGPVLSVIDRYAQSLTDAGQRVTFSPKPGTASASDVRFVDASIVNGSGVPSSQFAHGDEVAIEFTTRAGPAADDQLYAVTIRTSTGVPVLHLMADNGITHKPTRHHGNAFVRCTLPRCSLYPGTYTVSLWAGSTPYRESDYRADALTFHVNQGALLEIGFDLGWHHGLVQVDSRWDVIARNDSSTADHSPALVLGR